MSQISTSDSLFLCGSNNKNASCFLIYLILNSVNIETNEVIGSRVFSDCSSLKRVKLPAELESIPGDMFLRCTSLKEITIPETVKYIGYNAFNGCESLGRIKLPESLTTIGESAFQECGFKSITIPEGYTSRDFNISSSTNL